MSFKPEPPLFPADPDRRTAVEEAERFGDEDLQQRIREILLWSLGKDGAPLRSFLVGAKIGLPHGHAVRDGMVFCAESDSAMVGTY